jgi:hypothetical protein
LHADRCIAAIDHKLAGAVSFKTTESATRPTTNEIAHYKLSIPPRGNQ